MEEQVALITLIQPSELIGAGDLITPRQIMSQAALRHPLGRLPR